MANLNDLAVKVAKAEGLKQETNIAQIKEIMRVLGGILYAEPDYIFLLAKKPRVRAKAKKTKGKARA